MDILNGRLNDFNDRQAPEEANPAPKKEEDEKKEEATQTMIDMKPFGCVQFNDSQSAVKVKIMVSCIKVIITTVRL